VQPTRSQDRSRRRELRVMNRDDQSLYAEMRAAIRGDRERAARRAEKKRSNLPSTSPPAISAPRRFDGVRRLFGGRRDRS
jgi:hypothetical protein